MPGYQKTYPLSKCNRDFLEIACKYFGLPSASTTFHFFEIFSIKSSTAKTGAEQAWSVQRKAAALGASGIRHRR